MRKSIALLVTLAVTAIAFAELSPEVYRQMQQEAPEVVQIEVLRTRISRKYGRPEGCRGADMEVTRNVTLTARVLSVVRTRAGVAPGKVITIRYTSLQQCSGWVGPRPIPVLEKKAKVYAYLAKGDRGFAPAARGASFEKQLSADSAEPTSTARPR